MAKREIIWRKKAQVDFFNIIEFISSDSPENAISVYNRVTGMILLLPEFPKMYKADELKTKNDGSFRVFVNDGIRISYQITPELIRIIRVRHTSQEPLEY